MDAGLDGLVDFFATADSVASLVNVDFATVGFTFDVATAGLATDFSFTLLSFAIRLCNFLATMSASSSRAFLSKFTGSALDDGVFLAGVAAGFLSDAFL